MRLTSLFPRFRILTLLGLIAFVALALTLLPVEEWRDTKAIEQLSKSPFRATIKWDRPKHGLAAIIPWRKHVTAVVIDNWEPAPGQTQIPAESLLPLQRLHGLEFLQFHDFGSEFPMPPIPRLPQVKTLWLVCNIDPESTKALAEKFPTLEHLYVAPGLTPDDTSGMFKSAFALASLKSFECWGLRLSVSDVLAMKDSSIEDVEILDGEVTDEALAQFAKLSTLKRLNIWSNEFTDDCLDAVAKLKQAPNLEEITIHMQFSKETKTKIDQGKLLEARAGQTILISPLE